MPRFPKRETEIVALSERLYRGLLDNNTIFPFPPVHPILIRIKKLTELEYRVIAVNKAGEGQPSNTVAVVL